MLSIDDFQKITLDDKDVFKKIYETYPPLHSDNVFTTLVSWMNYGNYKYTLYEDNIILMSNIDGIARFRPPIGKKKKKVFEDVLKLALGKDAEYPFGMITKENRDFLKENFPNLNFYSHRDFFEYIYQSSDLANLEGSDYRKIRNRLNKFHRRYEFAVEDITDENMNEIKKFLKRWCLWKDCESDPVLSHEKDAIFYSIDHFFELNLKGIIIRIDDTIEAMAIFEPMNPDTMLVHYEKASPNYYGIYKAINQETAKIVKEDYKYINRESDMGIAGLRRAKLSYRPHDMIEVFHLSKDELSKMF